MVPISEVQLFLGLVPDAPQRRCFLSPHWPSWVLRLELYDISIGDGSVDVTVFTTLNTKHVEVILKKAEAPLWGIPRETSGPGEHHAR